MRERESDDTWRQIQHSRNHPKCSKSGKKEREHFAASVLKTHSFRRHFCFPFFSGCCFYIYSSSEKIKKKRRKTRKLNQRAVWDCGVVHGSSKLQPLLLLLLQLTWLQSTMINGRRSSFWYYFFSSFAVILNYRGKVEQHTPSLLIQWWWIWSLRHRVGSCLLAHSIQLLANCSVDWLIDSTVLCVIHLFARFTSGRFHRLPFAIFF